MARRSKAQNSQPLTLLDMIEQAEGGNTESDLGKGDTLNLTASQSIEQQRQKLHVHKDDSLPWEVDTASSQSTQRDESHAQQNLEQATHNIKLEKIVTVHPSSKGLEGQIFQSPLGQGLEHTQLGNSQEGVGLKMDNEQELSKLAHGVDLNFSALGQAVSALVSSPVLKPNTTKASSHMVVHASQATANNTQAYANANSNVNADANANVTSKLASSNKVKRKSTKPKIEFEDFQYPLDPVQYVVCGIDEAGRGPLMGDVVAACVILDHNKMIPGIDDSKHLSEKKRDALAPVIKQYALAYGIGRASPAEIDELNILHATFLAMRRAYEMMQVTCNLALIDGNKIPPGLNIACQAVVKGDARVKEIGAASILAKTTRDADLYELDKQYPEYKFAQHKGYPTAAHLEVLSKLPILPCYRFSYGPVKKLIAERNLQILPDHTLVARTIQD